MGTTTVVTNVYGIHSLDDMVLQATFFRLIPLYIGAICWSVFYNTIYKHRNRLDDVFGLKSTSILFRQCTKCISSFFLCGVVSGFVATGVTLGLPWFYCVLVVIPATVHLIWQLVTIDYNDPSSCGRKFLNNTFLARMIAVGIVLTWHFYLRAALIY
jgi:4-hydroxybenzoate polyprenyltransferase